eukprot:jgi/Galph1/810/GphlegSOOS_G5483.1
MVAFEEENNIQPENNVCSKDDNSTKWDRKSFYGLSELRNIYPEYGSKCANKERLKDLEKSFTSLRFHVPRNRKKQDDESNSSQTENKKEEVLPVFLIKAIRGARHFITEIEYDFDGKTYVWNSRAHRKQLYDKKLAAFMIINTLPKYTDAIFVTSTALEYSMAIYESYVLFQIFIGWPFFAGALFYLMGAYANFLEVLNAPDVHPISDDVESLRQAAERYRRRHSYRWIGWEPYRIDYLAALIQLIGAGIYTINCLVGNGNESFTEYMFFVEYAHGWWCWNPKDVSFWATFLNVWGAVGFLLDGGFGFGSYAFPADSVYAYIATDLTLLIGCICFLIGSFLLIVEQSGPDATLLPGLVED